MIGIFTLTFKLDVLKIYLYHLFFIIFILFLLIFLIFYLRILYFLLLEILLLLFLGIYIINISWVSIFFLTVSSTTLLRHLLLQRTRRRTNILLLLLIFILHQINFLCFLSWFWTSSWHSFLLRFINNLLSINKTSWINSNICYTLGFLIKYITIILLYECST